MQKKQKKTLGLTNHILIKLLQNNLRTNVLVLLIIFLFFLTSTNYAFSANSGQDLMGTTGMPANETHVEIQPVWDTSTLQPITPFLQAPQPPAKEKMHPKNFRIHISPTLIDFGELSPTNPLLRQLTIEVINDTSENYSVFSYESSSPQQSKNVFIPDTSCDNSACTEYVAATWQNFLTYGFGYRCDDIEGFGCGQDFKEGFFKQFASESLGETMQPIISGHNTKKTTSKITYKLNIAGAQPLADYTNTVTYILAPGF